jgi:hypothetical protein
MVSQINKPILGTVPLIGMLLGILHNFFYWYSLGVNYFSFVGFQEIFVSAVQPIVYAFLIFFVITLFYYFVVRFLVGEEAMTSALNRQFYRKKNRLEILLLAMAFGGLAYLLSYFMEWIYLFSYLIIFFTIMVTPLFVRTLKFYGAVKRDLNFFEVYLIGVLIISSIFVCFIGYRSAYVVKNGSVGTYFEEKKELGRYSGNVGEYFVFYQDSGDLFFLKRSEVSSFTFIKD